MKDFDVWTFYSAQPVGPYPARWRTVADFGPSRLGITPSSPELEGRRVDLFGRTLAEPPGADPVESLRRYLTDGATESARMLARKAAVILEPSELPGHVAWP